MSPIKVTMRELVGTLVYETVYEFSSYDDFNSWEQSKRQELTASLNNIVFGDEGHYSAPFETDPLFEETSVVDINVGKKPKKDTTH